MIIYDILLILQYQVSTTVMDLIVAFCMVSCLYLCLCCCVSMSLPNFRWIKIYNSDNVKRLNMTPVRSVWMFSLDCVQNSISVQCNEPLVCSTTVVSLSHWASTFVYSTMSRRNSSRGSVCTSWDLSFVTATQLHATFSKYANDILWRIIKMVILRVKFYRPSRWINS